MQAPAARRRHWIPKAMRLPLLGLGLVGLGMVLSLLGTHFEWSWLVYGAFAAAGAGFILFLWFILLETVHLLRQVFGPR